MPPLRFDFFVTVSDFRGGNRNVVSLLTLSGFGVGCWAYNDTLNIGPNRTHIIKNIKSSLINFKFDDEYYFCNDR